MFQKITSVPRMMFWPRFGSECWWKAWWSLALHFRGLPAADYHGLLTRLSDIGLCLGYGGEQEISFTSCRDDYISLHCPVNYKKPISITHTYKPTPVTVCPAKHIWGQSEFIFSSTWLWTLLWYSTYSPKCSSVSLIQFRPPASSCYMKTGNTILPFVLFLSLMAKYKESLNWLIQFTLLTPRSVKRTLPF